MADSRKDSKRVVVIKGTGPKQRPAKVESSGKPLGANAAPKPKPSSSSAQQASSSGR